MPDEVVDLLRSVGAEALADVEVFRLDSGSATVGRGSSHRLYQAAGSTECHVVIGEPVGEEFIERVRSQSTGRRGEQVQIDLPCGLGGTKSVDDQVALERAHRVEQGRSAVVGVWPSFERGEEGRDPHATSDPQRVLCSMVDWFESAVRALDRRRHPDQVVIGESRRPVAEVANEELEMSLVQALRRR